MRTAPEQTPPAPPAEHRAEGVAYVQIAGAPGIYFGCQPYRAKLSTAACARRWREAQTDRGAKFEKCRGCPIGAAHAGETAVYYSKLYDANMCTRCGRGTSRRMIFGRLCISCYNREREFIRGRNAKGTVPRKHQLARRTIRYAVEGGGVHTLTIEHTADIEELMLAVLRKTRGRVQFAFDGRARMHQSPALARAEAA